MSSYAFRGMLRKAVVDISSAGVIPLRHIPDVIGLVGRREGAAESRVLQGRDIRSVRRYDRGHGRCAGIAYFPSGVVDVESTVATGGH